MTKITKTSINMFSLFKSLPFGCSASYTLRSCQVYKDESGLNLLNLLRFIFSGEVVADNIRAPRLINIDMQNCVTPTRRIVHPLASHLPKFHTSVDDFYCLIDGLNWNFYQLIDINLPIIFLPHLQLLTPFLIHKILDLILVDLEEAEVDSPLEEGSIVFLLLEVGKDEVNRLLNIINEMKTNE